jgi:hypothetical protein
MSSRSLHHVSLVEPTRFQNDMMLSAERNALREMLADCPEDELFERAGLQHRLAKIEAKLLEPAPRGLSTTEMTQTEERLEGVFHGVYRFGRTFEFKTTYGEIIYGKVGRAITNAEIPQMQTVSVLLMVTCRGARRPSYTLIEPPSPTG